MVPLKLHVATVYPVGQTPGADRVLGNPVRGVGVVVRGYWEPLQFGEVLQRFGVELNQAASFQCEIADAGVFTPEAEVAVGGVIYAVKGRPEIHSGGTDADHADILLAFKQYSIG